MALDDIRRERLKKLESYEAAGRNPYPATVRRNFLIGEVVKKFSKLLTAKKKLAIVGRLRALREHGGVTFGDCADASGKIQLSFSREELGAEYDRAIAILDVGDFLEASGELMRTKRGEPTLAVFSWRIIAKSLRPLPEKWHGLKDVEERYRRRYLDLLMNEEVRTRFFLRSRLLLLLRQFFGGEGFTEVETPVLQHLPGGALARPFRTHSNALDIDLYLRIAPELSLKELLVGGMEKVYELAKSFRNEGIDAAHNPEFTTIEWYAAYWDEEAMMAFIERLFQNLFRQFGIGRRLAFDGNVITLAKKFSRIGFGEVLKRHALIVDYNAETEGSLAVRARQFGIEPGPAASKGKIADEIYKKVCRPHLLAPTFVVGHPLDISPLAKRSEKDPASAARFQLVIAGLELANAYSELNDPREQRQRFEEQAAMRRAGEEEAHPVDEAYLEALEYGLPPAAGAGLGVDRLLMLLTDTKNIREVVLFPTLRPKAS